MGESASMRTVTELLDVLKAEFDVNVKERDNLRDHMDSLDFLELQFVCEKRWGVVIYDQAMAFLQTPELLADYIDVYLNRTLASAH